MNRLLNRISNNDPGIIVEVIAAAIVLLMLLIASAANAGDVPQFNAISVGRGGIGPFPIPVPQPPPPAPSGGLRAEHELVRRARGLPDYARNPKLTQIAQEWAKHCQRIGRIDHFSGPPGPNQSTPWSRATAAGYAYSGLSENLAQGQRNAREAVASWLSSIVGHADNVLSAQWTEVGYGQAGNVYCAVYARPAGARALAQTAPQRQQVRRAPAPTRYRCQRCCR